MEIEADHAQLKPNLLWLHMYAFTMGIGVFQTGWVLAGYSGAAHVFAAKFGWSTDEMKTWTSIINVSSIVGATIGSCLGSSSLI